jgi:hypothetical protein
VEGLVDKLKYHGGFFEGTIGKVEGLAIGVKVFESIVGSHRVQGIFCERGSFGLGEVLLISGKDTGFELGFCIHNFNVFDCCRLTCDGILILLDGRDVYLRQGGWRRRAKDLLDVTKVGSAAQLFINAL